VMNLICQMYALKFLTIADASVIKYCGPIFTILMGHFMLGEKCGIVTISTGNNSQHPIQIRASGIFNLNFNNFF